MLLVNLGTPDGTDFWPMRRYLSEFLSDPRVIEWPRALWYPILYGIVLTTRPQKSGANYEKIWNSERNESPLRTYHPRAGRAAGGDLRRPCPTSSSTGPCATASRRSSSAVERLTAAGCERILMFPLYPQYSATTTATANDKLFER